MTPPASGLAYVDGRVVPLHEARVPLRDRGFLLGDGIFETLRTHDGAIHQAPLHAQRLRQGVRALGLPEPAADEAWRALESLRRDAVGKIGPSLYLRLTVTTGQAEAYAGAPGRYAVYAFARPLQPYPTAHYEPGIRVAVASMRKPRSGPLVGVKTLSSLPHVAARREARARGAHDAILLNDRGRVCEATTSNVLAVRRGRLHAPGPKEGAVDGVTRRRLVEAARSQGLTVETSLTLRELMAAHEVILTNTIGGVVPVAKVLGTSRRPAGSSGPIYKLLSEAYRRALEGGGARAAVGASKAEGAAYVRGRARR